MLVIHARTLDPLSRAARVALREKQAMFHVREVAPFEADAVLLALQPEGRTPVLVDDSWGAGGAISEPFAAFEYLEDLYPAPPLFPGGPLERAAARSLAHQAARAFGPAVEALVTEKARKRILRQGAPDTTVLRRESEVIHDLLAQAGAAADRAGWLTGARLSLADIVAAAHVSVLDFIDVIRWDSVPEARTWYARIKSRPSFRPLLGDALPGLAVPAHYADPDF